MLFLWEAIRVPLVQRYAISFDGANKASNKCGLFNYFKDLGLCVLTIQQKAML